MFKRDEIGVLDDSYNFPVNIAGEKIFKNQGKVDLDSITFLHYHHSFYDMDWTKFFNFGKFDYSWFISKLPLPWDLKTAKYRKKREYIRQYIIYYYWKIKLMLGGLKNVNKPKNQLVGDSK